MRELKPVQGTTPLMQLPNSAGLLEGLRRGRAAGNEGKGESGRVSFS